MIYRPKTANGHITPSLEMESREYRLAEFIPGYAGHIPKLNNTFGSRFTVASRAALKVPPVPSRPLSAFIPAKSQRVVETHYNLPGNNFSGLAEPNDDVSQANTLTYIQGSAVDLHSYYESLEATNYDKLTIIKSGSPKKSRSHIDNGDRYYYSGRHMWETTYMDSFHKNVKLNHRQQVDAHKKVDPEEVKHRYGIVQAVVGKRRLDELEYLLKEKLTLLLKTGQTLSSAFKVYNKDRDGRVTVEDFLLITRQLGIHVTQTEGEALFGRYDHNNDGNFSCDEWVESMTK